VLVNVNAYHQPGVEAGKKAAATVLEIQAKIVECLSSASQALTVDDVARTAKLEESRENIFKILRHLAANGRVKVAHGASVFEDTYVSA
jgi:glucose-6-phosphate isomerase